MKFLDASEGIVTAVFQGPSDPALVVSQHGVRTFPEWPARWKPVFTEPLVASAQTPIVQEQLRDVKIVRDLSEFDRWSFSGGKHHHRPLTGKDDRHELCRSPRSFVKLPH